MAVEIKEGSDLLYEVPDYKVRGVFEMFLPINSASDERRGR